MGLNHSFTLLFTFYKLLSLKKRLLKFDQELLACWKKSYDLRHRLPTHWSYFTCKIWVNFFGSGSAGSNWCGSCLQIYRFHIPGQNKANEIFPLIILFIMLAICKHSAGLRHCFYLVILTNDYAPWTINTIFAILSCYLGSEFRQNCRQKHSTLVNIFYFAHWPHCNIIFVWGQDEKKQITFKVDESFLFVLGLQQKLSG